MRPWLWLIPAAATEVGWVIGINSAATPLAWLTTVVCVIASVALAFGATRTMAATTVYALFVGLGTLGTVAVDLVVFDAPLHPATLAFIALLVAGVAGLRLTEDG
jgi:paired small multidrug resistance pump